MNTRLTALDEDVTTIESDVAEQDERMTVLESSVDLWDDRIIALEVANTEISERLTTLEDTILSDIFKIVQFLFFMLLHYE